MAQEEENEENAPLLKSKGNYILNAHKRFHKWRKISRPDGLEAWCVALAACFINFIMAGTSRSTGIFYVKVIDIFKVDRKQASIPFTVRSLTRNLLGPAVGILGQKYGVQPIIIVGGIIGTISAASCFFVKDILWMTILWGVFNGFGSALIITLTQAAIGEHFVKHKSAASGMGFSGGCIGSFVFPVLLDFLLYEYDLGGTFLCLAGIIMHVLPAAFFMKKPSWSTSQPINISDGNAAKLQEFKSEKHISYMKIDEELLLKHKQLVLRLLTDDFKLKYSTSEIIQSKLSCDIILAKDIQDLFNKIVKDDYNDTVGDKNGYYHCNIKMNDEIQEKRAHREDTPFINESPKVVIAKQTLVNPIKIDYLLFYLEHLIKRNKNDLFKAFPENEYGIVSKIYDELQLVYTLLTENESYIYSNSDEPFIKMDYNAEFDSSIERSNTFFSHIKTALLLHTKPLFLLISLCRTSHFLTFVPIVTIVVDLGRDKGVPEHYGTYVIAALSAGDLIGRLFSGWITDKGLLTLPRYMLIFMILQGVSTVIIAFMNSITTFLFALIIYGLFQGSVLIQHPVLVSRYLGKNEQSIALGCINFLSGFIGFALPFYIGYFRDHMGSYDGMLFINGASGAFVGLLWILEPYLLKTSKHVENASQQTKV